MLQHQLLPLPLLRFLGRICSSFQASTFVLGIKLLEFVWSLLFSHQLKMKYDFVTMAAVWLVTICLKCQRKVWADGHIGLHCCIWSADTADQLRIILYVMDAMHDEGFTSYPFLNFFQELTINRMSPEVVYDFTSFTSEWNNSSPLSPHSGLL